MRIVPRLPLAQRLRYSAAAFVVQNLLLGPVALFDSIRRDHLGLGAVPHPDVIKTYPVRKGLPVRIFYPKSYDKSNPVPLPVLLSIHGGGFVIGNPQDNDAWNASFASKHSFLVIALNYHKAPGSPFPAPIHDAEALIGCVLSDPALLPSINPSRVALLGFSAGGNLALALSQLDSIRPRIQAVVPIYPVIDFVTPQAAKTRLRQYKPSIGGFRSKPTDYLLTFANLFDWSYLPVGQKVDDPLVSPVFATAETLPKNVFVIGCELDMLGHEDWRFACKLAGRPVPSFSDKIGRPEPAGEGELITAGDERFAWEEVLEGGERRVRWLLIPDVVHGFDQDIGAMVGDDRELLEDAAIKTEKIIDIVGEWLLAGPLKV
ncbi:Alpha/Beta hydrolase protein [Apodospora peruviana]|uniref:Alpha/Beta hydrolase protein n=1 Tax=Apodospora peruviana TaxID=516989 RepID=A0AAE0LY80_9PEZI|nr:Alpha/Beta hydrolase protein [Apodospora peruviana]